MRQQDSGLRCRIRKSPMGARWDKNLNSSQNVVIFLCNAHQLLFAAILVQRLGRRQGLFHVHRLRVRHDVGHALQQQVICAFDGRVTLFVKLLALQILKGEGNT